jgi:hypothetical protein
MRMPGRSLMLAAACLCGLAATAAADEAVIRITYTEIHDRIKPTANLTSTKAELEVRIQQSGELKQSEQRASGGASRDRKAEMQLGASTGRGAWRVQGENEIVNTVDYPSYERAIFVTIDGDKCTARIGYSLKSGFTDYRYTRMKTNEPAVARSVTAKDVTCSIKAAAS